MITWLRYSGRTKRLTEQMRGTAHPAAARLAIHSTIAWVRPLGLGSRGNLFRGLLSVHSRYDLHAHRVAKRPSTPKAPTASLPLLPLRLLPAGANQFLGGSYTRWSPAPFTA